MKHLKHIDFTGTLITDWFLEKLSIHCPTLRSLDLSGCEKVTNKGMGFVNKLQNLEELNVSPLHAEHNFKGFNLTSVSALLYLVFRGVIFGEKNILSKRVDIDNNGLKALSGHPKLKKITVRGYWTLHGLIRKTINDIGLAHLVNCPNLQHLNLSMTDVGPTGVGLLNKLQNLEHLNLSSCDLKSITGNPFIGMITLKSLNLRSCKIQDSFMGAIASTSSLEYVDLSYNHDISLTGYAHFKTFATPLEIKLNASPSVTKEEIINLFKDCPNIKLSFKDAS